MTPDVMEVTGSWLQQFTWDWFATFTFGMPVTDKGVQFRMKQYFDSLKTVASSETYSAWVMDKGNLNSTVHVHALIGAVGDVRCRCRMRFCTQCGTHLWKQGYAKVLRYDPELAATFYLTSKLNGSKAELEIEGMPH